MDRFVQAVVLQVVLLSVVLSVGCQQLDSKFDAQDSSAGARVVLERVSRPFFKVQDVETASSADAERLYEQAASISLVANHLLAAADSLSKADGSSRALLPFLNHRILRIYVSQRGLCSSALAAQLYKISQNLYGTARLQACQRDLMTALHDIFDWVADNVPLRLQGAEGLPDATAAWPDRSRITDARFSEDVEAALLEREGDLADAAMALTGSCGLEVAGVAELIPQISSALEQLHADLGELKRIALAIISDTPASRRAGGSSSSSRRLRSAMEASTETEGGSSSRLNREVGEGEPSSGSKGALGLINSEAIIDAARLHRRQTQQLPSVQAHYSYEMPPADFRIQPPSAMPKLLFPIIFHVFSYKEGAGIGPEGLGLAPSYAERIVKVANYMVKPANMAFFVKEVRYDPNMHPYLLMKNRRTWLNMPNLPGEIPACTGQYCLYASEFVNRNAADFPRSINVYVTSDASLSPSGILGWAVLPGGDILGNEGIVYIAWDQFSVANSQVMFEDGAVTLAHEIFHHLGVHHTFNLPMGAAPCFDNDYVADTPTVAGTVFDIPFVWNAVRYCVDLFWDRLDGDWRAVYRSWSVTLGIPKLDQNAWADSCPKLPGYDELGNFMTYSFPPCFVALGHFTVGQAQRAHYMTAEYNPVQYAWAQYYAARSPPPPPQRSPPPEHQLDPCKTTFIAGCACKSIWQHKSKNYSYCDNTPFSTASLWCEVADPSSCRDCDQYYDKTLKGPCHYSCKGTPQQCNRRANPPAGWSPPPPPPPFQPSPPPMPPPPPPVSVPDACKVSIRNCSCRSNWFYNETMGSYCSNFTVYGKTVDTTFLGCIVTPECPTFRQNPLQRCNAKLDWKYCAGDRVFRPPYPTLDEPPPLDYWDGPWPPTAPYTPPKPPPRRRSPKP